MTGAAAGPSGPWRAGQGRVRLLRPALLVVVSAICLGPAVAGCGSDDSSPAGPPADSQRFEPVMQIRITSAGVEPATVDVHQGEAIGITNVSPSQHRLSSAQLDTGLLAPGEGTLLAASVVGRFELRLDDDSAIALVITVEPEAG